MYISLPRNIRQDPSILNLPYSEQTVFTYIMLQVLDLGNKARKQQKKSICWN